MEDLSGPLLFGPTSDEQSRCSTYGVYGLALPLSLSILALGVFTLLGRGPLIPAVQAQRPLYKVLISGSVMALGSLGVASIIYRLVKNFGFGGRSPAQIAAKRVDTAAVEAKKEAKKVVERAKKGAKKFKRDLEGVVTPANKARTSAFQDTQSQSEDEGTSDSSVISADFRSAVDEFKSANDEEE